MLAYLSLTIAITSMPIFSSFIFSCNDLIFRILSCNQIIFILHIIILYTIFVQRMIFPGEIISFYVSCKTNAKIFHDMSYDDYCDKKEIND